MSIAEERPWLKNYPSGIPANIDTTQYENLCQFLEESFQKYAKLPAFYCMGRTITYKELDEMSKDFGAYLQYRGMEAGDRIALMMPNLVQYPIVLFGAIRAGMIIVNTNPLYTPREMKHQFTDSDVKAIVIAENSAANLESIIDETNIKMVITTSIGEFLGTIKGALVNFVVKRVKRMVPKFNIPNTVTVKSALKTGHKHELIKHNACQEDVVLHQYTGGTTGVSKGAMLTHGNLIANTLQVKAYIGNLLTDGQEISLSPLPMYHIFAFTVSALAIVSFGAKTVLVTNARDINSVIKEFNQHNISVFSGVNSLFNSLINNKNFKNANFKHLKVTIGGGMAVQNIVAEKWKEITGCTLSEAYGMTESSPAATINPLDGTAHIGTIGMPIPSTMLRVVDEEGNELGVEEIGELQIKGPQVMKGYYNRPEETAKTLKDGWLSTGDIGKMDKDGFFSIVDRKKDTILVSGFDVYPNEIEDVVASHPKVLEVAAIGIPNEKSGEVVKLFIVKSDKSLTEDEIITYCRGQLTGYKIPKAVEFRKSLPKTNVGKILRRELRTE